MDDLQCFFNSISVISGRLVGDNERLCAMEPCLQMKKKKRGIEPWTAKSVGLTYHAPKL